MAPWGKDRLCDFALRSGNRSDGVVWILRPCALLSLPRVSSGGVPGNGNKDQSSWDRLPKMERGVHGSSAQGRRWGQTRPGGHQAGMRCDTAWTGQRITLP